MSNWLDDEHTIASALDTNATFVDYTKGQEAIGRLKEFGVEFTLPNMVVMSSKLDTIQQARQLLMQSNPLGPYINRFYIVYHEVRQTL